MKIAKIFGIVLALHVLLISILLVQPGCQTGHNAPPDSTSGNSSVPEAVPGRVHSDFNSGLAAGEPPTRATPTRPASALPAATPAETFSAPVEGPLESYAVASSSEPAAPPTLYRVKKGDTLGKIAKQAGVSLDSLLDANGLTRSSVLQIGQEIRLPSGGQMPEKTETLQAVAASAAVSTEGAEYVVKSGDSLSKIARQHGLTVQAIKNANKLTSDIIKIGQKLILPGVAAAALSGEAKSAPAKTSSSSPAPGEGITYVVKSGDTLGAIAKKYGLTIEAIKTANQITDPRKLSVGQKLLLPGIKSAPPPSVAATSAKSSSPPAPASPTAEPSGEITLEQLEKLGANPEAEAPVLEIIEETPEAQPAEPTK